MRVHRISPVAAALLSLTTAAVQAQTSFNARLTIDQEPHIVTPTTDTGDPRPISFGRAHFTLNAAQTALFMEAVIFNIDVTGLQTADLNDNLLAAHIHAGALPAPTFGVVWGFFGGPDNDVNPDNLVVTPFASGVGGHFVSTWDLAEGNGGTDLAAQLPNILEGRSYLNFHTEQYRAGEIRGTLTTTPEPASMLLLGSGLAGLAALRRRRRRQ